jgi:two-component system cell cycle response regulator DivK
MALSERPGLILMDVSPPVIDGWEATHQGHGCDRQDPMIALAAHAMAGDRENAKEGGCDYDTKPVEIARLLGKMPDLLGLVSRLA